MGKSCVSCCKILALSFPHLSGGVETRTNLKRWISPSLAPKLYITKTLKSWSVLDLKFKLDSMLTQGTAGLREHSSKRSLLRRIFHRQHRTQRDAANGYSKGPIIKWPDICLNTSTSAMSVCKWSLYSPFTATVASPPLTGICYNLSWEQQFLLIATVIVASSPLTVYTNCCSQ